MSPAAAGRKVRLVHGNRAEPWTGTSGCTGGRKGRSGPAGSGQELPGDLLPPEKESGPGFLPGRMLVIIAPDNDVGSIVEAIVNANKSGQHGGGKIFVCPMISAVRVRTGEQGDKALL